MALIKCPECKTLVSEAAKRCPKCGGEVHSTYHLFASSIGAIFLGIALWFVWGFSYLSLGIIGFGSFGVLIGLITRASGRR